MTSWEKECKRSSPLHTTSTWTEDGHTIDIRDQHALDFIRNKQSLDHIRKMTLNSHLSPSNGNQKDDPLAKLRRCLGGAPTRKKKLYCYLFLVFVVFIEFVVIYEYNGPGSSLLAFIHVNVYNDVPRVRFYGYDRILAQAKRHGSISKEPLLPRVDRELKEDSPKLQWWYDQFPSDIKVKRSKRKLVLIVSSAPQRYGRRSAIRDTWWKQCKKNKEVECVFFTDGIISNQTLKNELIKEKEAFDDIHVQPLSGGVNFGQRFLYHLRWAIHTYDFSFFMRLDDDMLLCFDRLLLDLDRAPQDNLIWSWVHCAYSLVRPEESFIIISQDIVRLFLSQHPNSVLCHPWADQQIGIWINQLGLRDLYYSDERIHHHPPARDVPEIMYGDDLCLQYVAIHGAYEEFSRKLWAHRGQDGLYPPLNLPPLQAVCPYGEYFDWRYLFNTWNYEPKLCAENPVWTTDKQMQTNNSFYAGRETSNE